MNAPEDENPSTGAFLRLCEIHTCALRLMILAAIMAPDAFIRALGSGATAKSRRLARGERLLLTRRI